MKSSNEKDNEVALQLVCIGQTEQWPVLVIYDPRPEDLKIEGTPGADEIIHIPAGIAQRIFWLREEMQKAEIRLLSWMERNEVRPAGIEAILRLYEGHKKGEEQSKTQS